MQPAPPAPPAAEFGVAPASLPSTPVGSNAPVPTVSWGAAPGADATAAAVDEEKPQSPFYFTRFTWGNTVGTNFVGVGDGYQTPFGGYDMSFVLNLRYYFLNRPLDKAYVNVNLGFQVEVTDTAETTTTTAHQPLFNDLVIGAGYSHTVYQSNDKQWKTALGIGTSLTFPTSIASMGQGKEVTVGASANILQAIPLAGKKSDWFSDVLGLGSVGYYHLFSKCNVACNPIATMYPREIAGAGGLADSAGGGGATITQPVSAGEDQLAASGLSLDKARFNVTYFLTIYKDFSFGNTWEILLPFKNSLPATFVPVSTGNVNLGPSFTGSLNPGHDVRRVVLVPALRHGPHGHRVPEHHPRAERQHGPAKQRLLQHRRRGVLRQRGALHRQPPRQGDGAAGQEQAAGRGALPHLPLSPAAPSGTPLLKRLLKHLLRMEFAPALAS